MTTTEIEKRLTLIEQELANLKAERNLNLPQPQHPAQTLDNTHGTFRNDKPFQEAMRLGKKWRTSLDRKPRRRSSKAKRK